ncbi:MAG: hypothetical protein Roseis2KO_09180 [Roseivirga sp.]
MYQPDILIKSFLVSVSKSPLLGESQDLLKYKVCDFNDYSNNFDEIDFDILAKYKVNNLGFGVAKNIKLTWRFDVPKAIKLIKKTLPNNYQFSWYQDLNTYFFNNLEDSNFHYSANANFNYQEIDYLSPINIKDHSHLHSIPEIIIYTHYLFLLFKSGLNEEVDEAFHVFEFSEHKFPSPLLQVEYSDLNGKKYRSKYKFKLTAVNMQNEEVKDLTKEFAYLGFHLI